MAHPSGIVANATRKSSRVQLVRSPTTAFDPPTVFIPKVLKII